MASGQNEAFGLSLDDSLSLLSLLKKFFQRGAEIREMEVAQAVNRRRLEDLFQSMLHKAFVGET